MTRYASCGTCSSLLHHEGQNLSEQRHKKLPSSIDSDRKSLRLFIITVQLILFTTIAGGAIFKFNNKK